MAERHKLEPAYDPAEWREAETGDSGDDPLAELARLVQGIEKNPGKPLRPAPPRSESSARQQPAMRYESYPSSSHNEPDPFLRAAPVERPPSTAELASDLEAELMRELQASFNAVRAPMESPKQPELPPSSFDEVDFDAFAEVHYRRHAPMEAAPPPPPQPKIGIESLATWREQTRPRPKQAGPSFRQRLAEGAAESNAPLRTSAEIRYEPDPLDSDPEIAAVAAAAESFSNVGPERAQPIPSAFDHGRDDNFAYVPGYEPPYEREHDEEEHEIRASSGRRPLVLVGALLGVVLVGAIGFFAVTSFIGGESGPPPLIMADTGPIKVRPENPGGAAASSDQGKLIYDRVGGGDAANTELAPDHSVTTVSRPEAQQTEASREISRIILPDPTDPPVENEPAALGSESDAVGPKRVRTVVVRPDGTIVSTASAPANAPQSAAPVESAPQIAAAAQPAPRVAEVAPVAREPIAPAVSNESAAAEDPDELGFADDWETENPLPADDEPVGATKPPPAAAPAQKTGPISLLPKSGNSTSEPARVASVEPTAKPQATQKPAAAAPAAATASAATGAYFVQVSSQRSESAALAAYREVQRRFPGVLSGREPDIQRADLGSRGVYYRARVAPGLSGSEAVSLCTSLKNAGGDCIITQN